MDLILKNGTVVSDGVEIVADIAVTSGKIAALGDLATLPAASTIDCTGKYLFPGAVDLGVNLLEDGAFDPESPASFFLATRQAARGGVTTILTPMEVRQGDDFAEAIAAQRGADEAKACIDFSYHLLLDEVWPDLPQQLTRAITAGVPSVWAVRTGCHARYPAPALLAALLEVLPSDSLLVGAVWDSALLEFFLREAQQTGDWRLSFPEHLEGLLISLLAGLVDRGRAAVLLHGISTAGGVEALAAARALCPRLAGACDVPHLILAAEDDSVPPCWPPIRGRSDQQALFHGLEEGVLSAVISAHRPRPVPQLGQPQVPGVSSLSHFFPALYGEGVAKWRLTPGALSQAACADPAKLAGIYPRKGTLQPGADADIVIIDPAARKSTGHSQADPLQGDLADPLGRFEFAGAVEAVYLRGHAIFVDNGTAGEMHGQFLSRRMSLK